MLPAQNGAAVQSNERSKASSCVLKGPICILGNGWSSNVRLFLQILDEIVSQKLRVSSDIETLMGVDSYCIGLKFDHIPLIFLLKFNVPVA